MRTQNETNVRMGKNSLETASICVNIRFLQLHFNLYQVFSYRIPYNLLDSSSISTYKLPSITIRPEKYILIKCEYVARKIRKWQQNQVYVSS